VSRCTLKLGEAVVLVALGGPPEAEYALFDPGEIELLATEPGRIREIGYGTIAAHARARLAECGITPELARETAANIKPALARAYARGAAVRRVVSRFGPAELFEGGTFDADACRYAGTWLDLDALASDLKLPRVGFVLQALHLAALLAECDDETPLVLATSQVSAQRRPGERTFKRAAIEVPDALADRLRSLKPGGEREGSDLGPSKQEIVDWARERARLVPGSRDRMAAIEAALDTRDAPTRGPLADTELWSLETKLSAGDATEVTERLDAFERRRGRLPGTMYLRARLAFMSRTEDPKVIAERVSSLSTSMSAFHELQLLAAQAWVAAGDARRARAFARDLLDNKTVSDDLRMQALDVLETVGQSSTSLTQAAASPAAKPRSSYPDTLGQASQPLSSAEAPTPRSPGMGEPLPPSDRGSAPGSDRATSTPRPARSPSAPSLRQSDSALRVAEPRGSASRRSLPPGASSPSFRPERRADAPMSSPPSGEVESERVETLSLPSGLRSEPPPSDEAPRTPATARLSFTYLARELARELRVRHGTELRTDLDGLEAVQRHLREALPDGRVRTPDEEREVMRGAAFVAELLARRLGARWVDVEQESSGWSMLVPCRSEASDVLRVWPVGRVLRFIEMGHKERDLVSYYLELEARARYRPA
jgi:hypothetical protein